LWNRAVILGPFILGERKNPYSAQCSPIIIRFFLFLLEGVVRTDNRGKRTREHRDQDEPDGTIRNQRPGTDQDTGNFE
jgi:hypothetical protein